MRRDLTRTHYLGWLAYTLVVVVLLTSQGHPLALYVAAALAVWALLSKLGNAMHVAWFFFTVGAATATGSTWVGLVGVVLAVWVVTTMQTKREGGGNEQSQAD